MRRLHSASTLQSGVVKGKVRGMGNEMGGDLDCSLATLEKKKYIALKRVEL